MSCHGRFQPLPLSRQRQPFPHRLSLLPAVRLIVSGRLSLILPASPPITPCIDLHPICVAGLELGNTSQCDQTNTQNTGPGAPRSAPPVAFSTCPRSRSPLLSAIVFHRASTGDGELWYKIALEKKNPNAVPPSYANQASRQTARENPHSALIQKSWPTRPCVPSPLDAASHRERYPWLAGFLATPTL